MSLGINMNPAETVIAAFGGLRATARALDLTPPSICYWRRKGIVPGKQMANVLRAAEKAGVKLSHKDLIAGR